jgi:1,4-dihydroxy-2-naphthoate polyprenyltransferase
MPLKMKLTSEQVKQDPGIIRIWIQAFRLQYVPTSIFPALLGSVIAWVTFREFNFRYFFLVIIGVTLHHMALNVIDDVFDYLHAVDRSHGAGKNPYTGGSGVLTGKLLSVSQMLGAAIVCYFLAVIIAVYLTMAVGWPVLIFVGIGLFSSVFYSTPPIRYGYRGFGELSLLINFGPIICLGAFYVQTRSIAWEPFIISLVPGFLMWSMIVINEIPDYEEDSRAGKLNLVARLGRKPSVLLYAAGLICAYGTMLLAVSFKITSFNILLGLFSIPFAVSALRILNENYRDKLKMIPANLATIKIHALTMSGLIIGYLAKGVVL